ncbi:hypothetical protein LINPERHAP1_LOCUS15598 [Linum perenne]
MISIQALSKYGCNQCSTGFHASYDCELGVDTYSSISAIEESSIFAALLNAKTRGAAGDTQPRPEGSRAEQHEPQKETDQTRPDKEKAEKERPEKKRSDQTSGPPEKNLERPKRRKTTMRKDSGKKKTGGGSRPETPSGEYSTARLPLMQPTLSGSEILTRAALQLAADWDIDHPRSEDGVRRMAMEQMAIGARLLGTAGALLSADQAHRAEQPPGVEEMKAELREARAATQQWKAKYSKAKKEMDEEAARLLAEQQKRYKVENALTQAEADRDALKEKVVLLETDKADMAKDLGAKTKDLESRDLALKEMEETLQALRADVKKAVAEKTAEELGDRVQGRPGQHPRCCPPRTPTGERGLLLESGADVPFCVSAVDGAEV